MADRIPPDPDQGHGSRRSHPRPSRRSPDWVDPYWDEWWGSRSWRHELDRRREGAEQAMQQFEHEAAIDELAPWLIPSADYLEALTSLATCLCHLGICEEAETLYRFVLVWRPRDPITTAEYAFFLMDHQRPEEAEPLCREALVEYSDAPGLWEALARALMDQERYQEALPALDEAHRLDPEWGEAYGLEALCYASLGEEEQAERAWRQALTLSPQDMALRWHYGLWLQSQDQFEEALSQLLSVLEAQPRYVGEEGVHLVADCYRSLGRFREADMLLHRFGLDKGPEDDL